MTPANRALALGLAAFTAVCVAGLAAIATPSVPNYGSWTGIHPLERKMEMLGEFASRGEVDAIALGSSIVDFGFSAELFSQLMSRHLGREYRMFNFASGGAEPRTLPKLYRFARLVARPREVFVIAPPEARLQNEIYEHSPDYTLKRAPVGGALRDQRLFEASYGLWKQPFLRNAPAIRDLLLFRHYRGLQAVAGMEAYQLNGNGDRLSFLAAWSTSAMPAMHRQSQEVIGEYPGGKDRDAARLVPHYFSPIDAEGLAELRELVRQDGGRLVVLSHAAASVYWGRGVADAGFAASRRDFYAAMAAALGAKAWDVTDMLSVPTYALSDVTHLNVYGARLFTRAAFAAYTGTPFTGEPSMREGGFEAPPLDALPKDDLTFNPYAAVLVRPSGEAHRELRVRIVSSRAVPPLRRDAKISFVLRLPDDMDRVFDAEPTGGGEFVARVDFPAVPVAQVYVLRLVTEQSGLRFALSNPVAGFSWIR